MLCSVARRQRHHRRNRRGACKAHSPSPCIPPRAAAKSRAVCNSTTMMQICCKPYSSICWIQSCHCCVRVRLSLITWLGQVRCSSVRYMLCPTYVRCRPVPALGCQRGRNSFPRLDTASSHHRVATFVCRLPWSSYCLICHVPLTFLRCAAADPSNHAGTQPSSGTPSNAQNLIRNAIAYATAGTATGAYVCLSQVVHYPATSDPCCYGVGIGARHCPVLAMSISCQSIATAFLTLKRRPDHSRSVCLHSESSIARRMHVSRQWQ